MKFETAMKLLFAMMIVILILLVMMGISSCTWARKAQSSRSDSTVVHRVDTVHVVKEDNNRKTDSSWWREIINLLPQPQDKDTIINNTMVPVNNYYPAQLIREGGTLTKEEFQRIVDSMAASKKDTTTVSNNSSSSDTKVKVLSMWQIIGLAAGVCFLMIVLSKLKIGLK